MKLIFVATLGGAALVTTTSAQHAASTLPAIAEIPRAPFVAAYGDLLARQLTFSNASFSASSERFAVALAQIATGDPEEVWVGNVRTRAIRRITEPVDKANIGFHVEDVTWGTGDECVTVKGSHTDWKNQSNNQKRVVVACDDAAPISHAVPWPSRSHEAAILDSPGAGRWRLVLDAQRTTLLEVKTSTRLNSSRDIFDKAAWISEDRFFFVKRLGHGSLELWGGALEAKPTSNPKLVRTKIDDGSWELMDAIADLPRHQIARVTTKPFTISFTDDRWKPAGEIRVRRYPTLLAISRAGAILYSANGCLPDPAESGSADGKDSRHLRTLCLQPAP